MNGKMKKWPDFGIKSNMISLNLRNQGLTKSIIFKMKHIEQLKFLLHRHFRLVYGVTLTQAQLDDIHDFYHQARKEMIKQIGYYRFVNMMLGIIVTLLWFVFGENPWNSWFFLILSVFFIFYNMIHAGINYVQYKRIKEPKRPSDEG